MNAWATTIISGLVLVVAFMQWRTAHQKVMLDLFDRRLKAFDMVRSAVRIVNSKGHGDQDAEIALLTAINESQFLFGDDVRQYLDKMWENYANLQGLAMQVDNMERGPVRKKAIEEKSLYFLRVTSFYKNGADVFAPYMRMDQKRVRTPME